MNYSSRIAVLPKHQYCAEVILLLTSLGANRSELNNGKRLCSLLEVKRVHTKVIDYNRDARAGHGKEEEEFAAIERLFALNPQLAQSDDEAVLPQMFLDGWYVGGLAELQALEDDGVLGRLLRRELCFNCFGQRNTKEMWCCSCGAEFEEVLPARTFVAHLARLQETADAAGNNDDVGSSSETEDRYNAFKAALQMKKPELVKAKKAIFEKQGALKPRKSIQMMRVASAFQRHDDLEEDGDLAVLDPHEVATPSTIEPIPLEPVIAEPTAVEPRTIERSTVDVLTLPTMQGYMWKKVHNQFRLRSFTKRYFVTKGLYLIWWTTQEDAEAEFQLGHTSKHCKGFIDFSATPVDVQISFGNETSFTLKPRTGKWTAGGTSKEDSLRDFTFDVVDSEQDRAAWLDVIYQLMQISGHGVTLNGKPLKQNKTTYRKASSQAQLPKPDTEVPAASSVEVVADASFYEAIGLPVPKDLK